MSYASLEEARQKAEAGNAAAQSFLGAVYLAGAGVEPDPAEAMRWFTASAEQGYAQAQNDLAMLFAEGVVVPRDDAQALFWFRAAAEQGLVVACLNLARCYTDGRGTAIDLEERVAWLKRAAEAGDVDGLNELGVSLLGGLGVEPDPAAAVVMFLRAAEQGLAHAQFNLAECLEVGRGLPADPAEAVRWYARAADVSFPPAMNNLGLCLEGGRGADKDPATAFMLFRAAAAQSFPPAEYNVGRCYEKGIGVAVNLTEASLWYYKAARVGHDAAMVAMARLARLAEAPVRTGTKLDRVAEVASLAKAGGPGSIGALEEALLDEEAGVRLAAWDGLVEVLGLAKRLESPRGVRELTTEIEVMRVLLASAIKSLAKIGASSMRNVSRRLAAGATPQQLGIAWRPNRAEDVFEALQEAIGSSDVDFPVEEIAKLKGPSRQLAEAMILRCLEHWDARAIDALVALDAAWTAPVLAELALAAGAPAELRGVLSRGARELETS